MRKETITKNVSLGTNEAQGLLDFLLELQAEGVDLSTTYIETVEGQVIGVALKEIDHGDGSKSHDIRLALEGDEPEAAA